MNHPTGVTERFSDRVEHYIRYRPDYPPQLVDWLHRACAITAEWVVADIGAGTGISTQLFLDAGHRVIAVEPNAAMRAAADSWLGEREGYRSVDGRAEATGLDDASVDLVVAAQAFHWFDKEAVRTEWRRILRPGGMVAVFWNSRRIAGDGFLDGYEQLLRTHGTDYDAVAEGYPSDGAMRDWFGNGFCDMARFEHHQWLDCDGLCGRLRSSSYTPPPEHPGHTPMMEAARALFDAHAEAGRVDLIYDTRIFVGSLA